MKIVFATNNAHKLQEVRQILGDRFEIPSKATPSRKPVTSRSTTTWTASPTTPVWKSAPSKEHPVSSPPAMPNSPPLRPAVLPPGPSPPPPPSPTTATPTWPSSSAIWKINPTATQDSAPSSRYYTKERSISSKESWREKSSASATAQKASATTPSSPPKAADAASPR